MKKNYMFMSADTILSDLPRKILSKRHADYFVAEGHETLGDLAKAYDKLSPKNESQWTSINTRYHSMFSLLVDRSPNLISSSLTRDLKKRHSLSFPLDDKKRMSDSIDALLQGIPREAEFERVKVLSALPADVLSKRGADTLEALGMQTFGDLTDLVSMLPNYGVWFLSLPGIGIKTVKQITQMILKHGSGFAYEVAFRKQVIEIYYATRPQSEEERDLIKLMNQYKSL